MSNEEEKSSEEAPENNPQQAGNEPRSQPGSQPDVQQIKNTAIKVITDQPASIKICPKVAALLSH